jgi:hypothetical protein
MRNKILAAIAGVTLLGGAFFGGTLVNSDAPVKIKTVHAKVTEEMRVDLYNDGFMDGSCKEYDGIKVDGWGNYCKTAGIHK